MMKANNNLMHPTTKREYMMYYEQLWEEHLSSIKTKRVVGVKIGCQILFSNGDVAEVDGMRRDCDYFETATRVDGSYTFRLSNGKCYNGDTDVYAVKVL